MNNLARLDDRRKLAAQQATPIVPPSVASILDDSPYRLSPWSAGDALLGLKSEEDRKSLVQVATDVRAGLDPCDRDWLKKRLTSMALAFGHERDPDRAAAWLLETGRLLCDLPGDILATAIDEAIKRSERGFMPAVGQIRAIADPLAAARRQQSARLDMVAGLISRDDGADNVVRPRGDTPVAAAEEVEDLIPAHEVEAFNRNMRKFGLKMRCASDGRTFELTPDQPDPAE